MDLRSVKPELNLYNRQWPLRSTSYPDPPAKFTFDEAHRRGEAIDSIVSGGCILSGGLVRNSILGRGVRVHTGALVEGCVIMDNCDIGRHAKVRRAILDKNVRVPESAQIGYDLDADRARGWHVTDSGIVVIGGERSTVPVAALDASASISEQRAALSANPVRACFGVQCARSSCRGTFKCGAVSRIHLQRTLCTWVKIAAMLRVLPTGFAVGAVAIDDLAIDSLATHTTGSRRSISNWFMRSFAANIRTAARTN
jgi:hypothetical protein